MEGLPRVLAMAVRPSGFRYVAALFLFFFLLLQYRRDGSGITGLGGLFQQHVRESTCRSLQVRYCRGFQPVVRGPLGIRGELPRGPRSTPEKLETRCILTEQKYRPYQCCRYRLRRTELKTSLVFAMCNDFYMLCTVASTRVQGWGGDEPCEPTVRLPD